jgi:uncharacterized protein YndB with AHSA1/START domain
MTGTDDIYRGIEQGQLAVGEARSAIIRRHYDAPIDDVWAACTEPARLNRWFLPVTGDLRVGGTFNLEGNASGEILRCEPPRLLAITWTYGDVPTSDVELRLSPDGDGTALELEHAVVTDPFGHDPLTAAWGVGLGWELALQFGLVKYLRGELPDAPASEWFDESAPDMAEAAAACTKAWNAVLEAAGGTPPKM